MLTKLVVWLYDLQLKMLDRMIRHTMETDPENVFALVDAKGDVLAARAKFLAKRTNHPTGGAR